ncbi:MAG: extracellular solute-binding protein [Ruminococcus sp.]|jgi:hypothetical protein|nr:extracellular solute-binding protein [Ruminococcus sp.]
MNPKKIIAVLSAALLSCGILSGCKKEAPEAPKEHIFESKVILQSNEDFENIANVVWDGTNIYFYASKWESVEVPAGETDPMPIAPLAVETAVSTAEEEPADDSLESEETAETEEAADDVVLEEEPEAEIAVTADNGDGYVIYNDEAAAVQYVSTSYSYIVKADMDGNILNKKLLFTSNDSESYVSYNILSLSPDGKLYGSKQSSKYGTDADGNFFSEDKSEIVSYDSELNETVIFNVSDALKKVIPDENYYFYMNNYLIGNDSNFYINTGDGVYVIDPVTLDIKFNYTIDQSNNQGSESSYIRDICKMPDGTIGVILTTSKIVDNEYTNSVTVSKVNLATGKLDAAQNFPIAYNAVPGVGDYSFFTADQVAVYGYDKELSGRTLIIDLLASPIGDISINTVLPVTAEEFIVTAYSNSDGTSGVYLFSKVDPATIVEKKLIKVAALYEDYRLVQYIRSFNKTSAEYQVQFVDYSTDPNSNNDQNLTIFNNDIISGNIPDIILMDSAMPYDSYAAKGLLMDIMPRLKEDTELTLDMLVPSIIDAIAIDGKLYSISPTFNVMTLVGKTSIFGDKPGQSIAELQSKADSIPGAQLFDPTTVRSDFMQNFVYNIAGNYIDKATGECYFNTPEFISLLNLAKSFPEEFNYDDYDWMAAQDSFKNDKTLLNFMYMYNFRSIVESELVTFGEPVTFLGYPGNNGSTGLTATLSEELAIMAKAKNPDGAWEFVKGYVTYKDPNEQGEGNTYSILQSKLDAMAAEALERPFYIDYETKEKIYYDNTYYINNQEVKMPNNTPEDNAKIMAMINNISSIQRSENELKAIIEDDVTSFFSGQKSAEETAEIIQNRASTYVAESR